MMISMQPNPYRLRPMASSLKFQGTSSQPRFQGSKSESDGGESTRGQKIWTGFKIAVAVLGLGNLAWQCHDNFKQVSNPGSVHSLALDMFSSEGFAKDTDGSPKVYGPGSFFLMFKENMPFDTRPQMVQDTFQPFTRDGVQVDGKGTPAEGIDVRIQWCIDGGPTDDLSDADKLAYYKKSLPLLANEIRGNSEFKEENVKREAAIFPAPINEELGKEMRVIYLTLIAPRIQEALNIATTKINAADIHLPENREFLENVVLKGYSISYKDADGKTQKLQVVKPLQAQLEALGLRLKDIQVLKPDAPEVLADLNIQRSDIPLNRRGFELETTTFKAQVSSEKAAVQAQYAGDIQAERSQNEALLKGAQGAIETAKEAAKVKEQEALGEKNRLIAQAKVDAEKAKIKAGTKAAETIQEANVYARQQEALAAAASAKILEPAKVEAETLALLGEQLTAHPEYVEQLINAMASKNQAEVAKLLESMILAPGTSIADVLKTIRPESLVPQKAAKP